MDLKKIVSKLPAGFLDDAQGMDDAQLKAAIVTASGQVQEIKRERAGDEKLNGAKELAKEYAAPYRDALSCQDAKIAFCHYLLTERCAK